MQIYKVFINNKPIVFSSKHTYCHNVTGFVNIIYNKNLIFNDNFIEKYKAQSIIILCENPTKVFFNFLSSFKQITAAGGIVFNEKNEVLFIFRNSIWDLPKGKIETNEPIKNGAIREVIEETGITKINTVKTIEKTYHMYMLNQEYILKTTHWFIMKNISYKQLIPQTAEGITNLKWFSKEEINIPLSNTYESIRDLLTKCLGNLF